MKNVYPKFDKEFQDLPNSFDKSMAKITDS